MMKIAGGGAASSTPMWSVWTVVVGTLCLTEMVRGVQGGPNFKSGLNRLSEVEQQRDLMIGGQRTGGRRYPYLVHWDALTEEAESNFIRASGHGVMITNDVFLTLRLFRFEGPPKEVMVGDYDRIDNSTESIQARTVVDVASQVGPGGAFSLYKIHPPVSLPGFFPARLNADPLVPRAGQPVAAVGYGKNATSDSSDPDTQAEWPGEASQVALEVMGTDACFDFILNYNWDGPTDNVNATTLLGGRFCTTPWEVSGTESGHGEGDWGGPVVDGNHTLLGLVGYRGYYPSQYPRISSHIQWIQDTTCRLSDSKTLSFCDDIACPVDAVLYGFPRAKLADRTGLVKTHNQYSPDGIVQDPEPGSFLKAGTETNVTIRATNYDNNETRSCVWKVTVPPVSRLGVVRFRIDPPCGQYQETGVFGPDAPTTTPETRALSGIVRRITGFVSQNVTGIPAIQATITDAEGPDLSMTLQPSETRAFVTNLSIPVTFSSNGESGLAVTMLVHNDTSCTRRQPFVVTFVLRGQANEPIPTMY